MLPRYRQRRGPYALAEPSPIGGIIRRFIILGAIALVLYFCIKWILGAMGVGNHVERRTVLLNVEERSNVTVSLDGGLMQRADGTLKLWPGDRVVTNAGSHARLTFFDGSMIRLDEQSELAVKTSNHGTRLSEEATTLSQGALWLSTPPMQVYSGSVMRTIATTNYTATIPSDAEVVIGARSVLVFSADGDGVQLEIDGADALTLGEGQQLVVPEGESFTGDLRRFRSAMDPLAVRQPFVEESRLTREDAGSGTITPSLPVDTDVLTIETPVDDQTISGATVHVQGTVGARVERVRVNGYPATIQRQQGTYSQELVVPASETFTIRIEALDRTGVILEQQERTVRIAGGATGPSPTITAPGTNGQTVHTTNTEVVIRGTVPAGTSAVYVNDYKLQLYRAGNSTWSYLANASLGNLKAGENVYTVISEDASGNRSAPATITIVQGDEAPTTGGASSSVAPPSQTSLPQNDPLRPGTLRVTSPAEGTSAVHTGTGFLLEGTTIAETASVWVNDYKLQLYEPGRTFWNYWALPEYNTLKRGTNVYRIVSRNVENQILDVLNYTVEYNPE